MKRTSLAFSGYLAAAIAVWTPFSAMAEPPSLQSRIDVFFSCIEQNALIQRQRAPAARSADAVRVSCAAHRAALEPLLGAGAREMVDAMASRRVSEVLAVADAAPDSAS